MDSNNNTKIINRSALMARKHGAAARIKSARLQAMLKVYAKADKVINEWLLFRIIATNISVNRHLRHSTMLADTIKKYENRTAPEIVGGGLLDLSINLRRYGPSDLRGTARGKNIETMETNNKKTETLLEKLKSAKAEVKYLNSCLRDAKTQVDSIKSEIIKEEQNGLALLNMKVKVDGVVAVARLRLKHNLIQVVGLNEVAKHVSFSRTGVYAACENKETLVCLLAIAMLKELRALLDKHDDRKKRRGKSYCIL